MRARTYTRAVTRNTGTSCLSEGYESYSNDKTTCCQPPVCSAEERSQHREMTARGRGNGLSPLSPSAHHSLTPPPPFLPLVAPLVFFSPPAVSLHYFHICLSLSRNSFWGYSSQYCDFFL